MWPWIAPRAFVTQRINPCYERTEAQSIGSRAPVAGVAEIAVDRALRQFRDQREPTLVVAHLNHARNPSDEGRLETCLDQLFGAGASINQQYQESVDLVVGESEL